MQQINNNPEFISGLDIYKKADVDSEKYDIIKINSDGDEEKITADYRMYPIKDFGSLLVAPKDLN